MDLIKQIKRVSYFDDRAYIATFLNGQTETLVSTTTVLGVAPKEWLATLRGEIGNREADARMHEAGLHGDMIHKAMHLYAKGGVVLFQWPKWKGIWDEDLYKQNEMVIAQCKSHDIPYMILEDQEEMLKFLRLKAWNERVFSVKGVRDVAAEVVVWDLVEKTAGTADRILYLPGGAIPFDPEESQFAEAGHYIVDYKSGKVVDDEAFMQVADYGHMALPSLGLDVIGGIVVHVGVKSKVGIKTHLLVGEEYEDYYQHFLGVKKLWHLKNPNFKVHVGQFDTVAYRGEVEGMLTGFVEPPQTPTTEQIASVGQIAVSPDKPQPEKKPKPAPKAPKPAPEPEPQPEPEPEPEQEEEETPLTPTEEVTPEVSQKDALIEKARSLARSVYPGQTIEEVRGISTLMQRAFLSKNKQPIIDKMADMVKLEVETLREGIERLQNDVDTIKVRRAEREKAKAKK